MTEFIYLFIGMAVGFLLAMNTKEWREQKTYEQLDKELRDDLNFYKNTVSSQKTDVEFYKQKVKFWKDKYENLYKQIPKSLD
jgi:uncharacterized membrane-anchored protein YhcB (DUF1043 family)